jgi:general control protein GCN4
MRDPTASAPASTSFTNLTSPSIFDSPEMHDSYETSPWVNGADVDLNGDNHWFSLFPDQTAVPGESGEESSPPNPTEDYVNDPLVSSTGPTSTSHRRSSPGQSPAMRNSSGKHSSISGVGSRKRDKPLPPIVVDDPHDTIAIKRARNTLAARKSRQKKVERFEELEKTIEELKDEVEHWKKIALSRSGGQV